MTNSVPAKDPAGVDPYFFVFCDIETGLNDGSVNDDGDLQGATISTYALTIPNGITKDSDNKDAVTIHGVTYGANTVVTVWLSGGTVNTDYELVCVATLSDGRVSPKRMTVPVRYR